MRRVLWLGVLSALSASLVACGREPPAQRALDDTEQRLGRVRSGVLTMKLLASPAGAPAGRGVGFELQGPFAVAEDEGSLPVADLAYTRVTGDQRRTTRFTSTGARAFVHVGGRAYELEPAQVADLRATGDDDAGDGGLDGLHLDDWIDAPRLRAGPGTGAGAIDLITGTLDPVAALNDVLALAVGFGVSEEDAPRRLEGEGAERVRRAVRGARVVLATGRSDRLLRRLQMHIDLGVEDQEALREALGRLAGVRLSMDLAVEQPNRRVQVEAPSNARPASELD